MKLKRLFSPFLHILALLICILCLVSCEQSNPSEIDDPIQAEPIEYTVTVCENEAASIKDAVVKIFKDGTLVLETTTDEQGIARFTLSEANYSVQVTADEYISSENSTFSEGETSLCISLSPVPYPGLEMIENRKSPYILIYPADADSRYSDAATGLSKHIKRRTSATVSTASDTEAVSDYEILIGNTNRSESAAAMATLPTHGYSVTVSGSKIVVVGTDATMTALALYHLEAEVFDNPELCGKGLLRIPEDLSITKSYDAPLTVKEKIESDYAVTASTEFVLHGEQYTQKIRITQGAASDGRYAYFSVRRAGSDSVGGVIYKYDLQTLEKVAVSEEINFGHGNDLTFDTKNNRLIVSHGLSENHILTFIDPETLTVIDRVEIKPSGSSISYNPWTDSYAMGEGNKIDFMDSNFNLTGTITRKNYTQDDYVNQGMGSDKDFIYFPLSYSDKTKNLIVVFDWNGKLVREIQLNEPHESESIFSVNDTYYITFYHDSKDAGTYLHELSFEIIYKDRVVK